MKEIVAAKIGTYITNSSKEIMAAVEANARVEWLDRRHMKLMACMDLGQKWEQLAASRTLFRIDDAGELCEPEQGERASKVNPQGPRPQS
jgi:hypothetical protein